MHATSEVSCLIDAAVAELRCAGIESIVLAFQDTLNEFLAVVDTLVSAPTAYKELIAKLVTVLCDRFGVHQQLMHVRVSSYTADVWGSLFWKFLHYTSILVTYMYNKNEINDMLDFPLIVYNINHILPCAICKTHYLSIKNTDPVRAALKEMSFGNLMSGLQMFHNLITANIDSMPPASNLPPRQAFTMLDFARVYGCLEMPETETARSLTYIKNRVDWQPTAHRLVAVLYALVNDLTYKQSSQRLKSAYKTMASDASERERLEQSLEQALTLNIEKRRLEANLLVIEDALREAYSLYPQLRRLVREMPEERVIDLSQIHGANGLGVDSNNGTNQLLLTALIDKLEEK